ncbi:MAG: DUF72 domain-containing protein [Pseudoxanthomonas sp.]
MSPPRIRVGCAGWSIAREHAHLFGEGASALERYATRFHVTEINSSFYRPHQPKTYARWADSVPAGFRFSVKLPKSISHEQRLQRCAAPLDRFLDEIDGLGKKLGGLLVQLPPSLAFDARIASTFFGMLRRRTDIAIACEPRHASWFGAPAAALFERHSLSRVAADPAPCPEAAEPGAHGTWRYWRWHGSPRIYYSDYSEAALQDLARQASLAARPRIAPWIIFDNTAHGHATKNAARLQELLAAPASKKGQR